MTVELIKPPPYLRYKLTCTKCGAIFGYNLEDIKPNFRHGSEGVYCPNCAQWHQHPLQGGL